MPERARSSGQLANGVVYQHLGGDGPPLIVLQGLVADHRPPRGLVARMARALYGYLCPRYSVYVLTPRPGIPAGYGMGDLAADHAAAIAELAEGPVVLLGTSTGGTIAQHLAAGHPERVRRLVLHATGHTLGERGRRAQRRSAELALAGRWREAHEEIMALVLPHMPRPLVQLTAAVMARSSPASASDYARVIAAEDAHAFLPRLGEIRAPTLVIDGLADPFFSEAILRETAAGIPGAHAVLYPGQGHAPGGKAFRRDVGAFLEGR